MLEKYLERLNTLKETRALEVDTNTDEQNDFIDSEIVSLVKFIRVLKKQKEVIDDVVGVLEGNGVPNLQWVLNRLKELN